MEAASRYLIPVLLLLLLCSAVAAVELESYYCLDYTVQIGQQLAAPTVPAGQQITAGQTARWCNAQCDAWGPDCTAAWSAGAAATAGPACKLLQHTAADVQKAARNLPGKSYPNMQPYFRARDGVQNRTLAYLCFKQEQDWDAAGRTMYDTAMQGHPDGEGWCANSHDVAGFNIARFSNTTNVHDCVLQCRRTRDCTHITFMLTFIPDTGEPSGYDCWIKTSAMQGENGWTAAYQNDSYSYADSVITCFKNLEDWRKYGMVISPTLGVLDYNGLKYTLFPERVSFSEAQAVCASLPKGSLSILPSRQDVLSVGQQLLPMLPYQRSLQTAWVGVMGKNIPARDTAQNPAEGHGQTLVNNTAAGAYSMRQPQMEQIVRSLHWLDENSTHVQASMLKALRQRPFLWMWHDNVYSYQTKVDPQAQHVCGALTNQWPPLGLPPAAGDNEPGIYYFDCNFRPAAFVCQSSNITENFLQGQHGRLSAQEHYQTSQHDSDWNWIRSLIIGITVSLGTLAVLSAAVMACQCSRHVDRISNMLYYQRKRAQGKPTDGKLSVVMTDIKGFTHLMETEPDAMAKALVLHNHIIRKCCHDYAGCVLGIEGDAFVIAFHDPMDAVAFSLQVQQALLQADMPSEICYNDDWDGSCNTTSSPGQHAAHPSHKWYYSSTNSLPPAATTEAKSAPAFWRPPASVTSQSGQSARCLADVADALEAGGRLGRLKSAITAAAPGFRLGTTPRDSIQEEDTASAATVAAPHCDNSKAAATLAAAAPVASTAQGSWLAMQLRVFSDTFSAVSSHKQQCSSRTSSSSWSRLMQLLCSRAYGISKAYRGGSLPVQAVLSGSSSTANGQTYSEVGYSSSKPSGRNSSSAAGFMGHWWRQLLFQGSSQAGPRLFKGLRVRIGVASGQIQEGQDIESTTAYTSARVICDVANGGQILLDASTFYGIRDQLHRLGRVGPDGLDYQQLPKRKPGSLMEPLWPRLSDSTSRRAASGEDAVLLDMGLYETTSLEQQLSSRSFAYQLSQPQQQQQHAVDIAHEEYRLDQDDVSDHFAVEHSANALQLHSRSSLPDTMRRSLRRSTRLSHVSYLSRWRSLSLLSGSGSHCDSGAAAIDSCSVWGSEDVASATLRLYQVLSPGLAGRAALYGNTLHIPGDWKCLDRGYFLAPGLCDVIDPAIHLQEQTLAVSGQLQQSTCLPPPAFDSSMQLPAVGSHTSAAAAAAACSGNDIAAGPAVVGFPPSSPGATPNGSAICTAWSPGSTTVPQQQQQRLCSCSSSGSKGQSLAALRAASLYCSWQYTQAVLPAVCTNVLPVLPSFPAVTAVFVAVEGSQQLLLHQYAGIRHMHLMLHKLMLDVLLLIPGGYLVRSQEGELRYILTFTFPAAAVEWCLIVQEASLYLPYDQTLIQYRGLRVQHDAATGRLVFRGPRLKMGVAEGVPKAIVPDCWGRADYCGPFMNQAARFCDAAAHGGQIAADASFAKKVLQQWEQYGSFTTRLSSSSCSSNNTAAQNAQEQLPLSLAAAEAAATAAAAQHVHSNAVVPPLQLQQYVVSAAALRAASAVTPEPSTPPASFGDIRLPVTPDSTQQLASFNIGQPAVGAIPTEKLTTPAAAAVPGQDAIANFSVLAEPSEVSRPAVAVPVEVSWLGSFAFKGTSRPIGMVNFTAGCLVGRNFPPEAPRGKGMRISQQQGLMGNANVSLPSNLGGNSLFY